MFDTTYLHIGFDKTGSSAIQVACQENKVRLAEMGILYPDGQWHAQFGSFFCEDPGQYYFNLVNGYVPGDLPAVKEADASYMRNLRKNIQTSDARTMVLSYEGFSTLDGSSLARMRAFLDGVSKTTTVILYCREPVAYARSGLSQRSKTGDPFRLDPPVQPFRDVCERFSTAFGFGNLRVRKFDRRSMPGGDVRLDFFSQIGISEAEVSQLSLSNERDNSSLAAEAMLISESLRLLDTSIPSVFNNRYAGILEQIRGKEYQLPAEQVEAILAESRPHLEYLRETFGIHFDLEAERKAESGGRDKPLFGGEFVESIAALIQSFAEHRRTSEAGSTEGGSLAGLIEEEFSTPELSLHSIEISGPYGIRRGEVLAVEVRFRLDHDIERLRVGVQVLDEAERLVMGVDNESIGQAFSGVRAGFHCVTVYLVANLAPGAYSLGFAFSEASGGKPRRLSSHRKQCGFEVNAEPGTRPAGYAPLPVEMTLRPFRTPGAISRPLGELRPTTSVPLMKAGTEITMPVEVVNRSDEPWIGMKDCPVSFCYHWQRESGEMLVFDGVRSPAPAGGIWPGESLSAEMRIAVPDEAGSFILTLSLVQENVGWFERRGFTPAKLDVEVKAAT